MAASPTLTWDIDAGSGGARRPSLDDVGGATLVDDDPEPDKATMPYADQLNELQRQVAAMGKVVASTIISVHISGGTPAVLATTGPGTAIVPGLFTVSDNGTGDTSITWPAGSLPPPTGVLPIACVNGLSSAMIEAHAITNGVRVVTTQPLVGAADADFTVEVR